MSDLVRVLFVGVILGAFIVMVFRVKRCIAHARLHHRWSNRRFLRQYRDEHPLESRTTAAAPPPAPPVVRPRTPAGPTRTPTRVGPAGSNQAGMSG